jgi:hypothetical protein
VKLLTADLRKRIPPLYSQESNPDPIVVCKFFTPGSSWTWYVLEFDGDDQFFGFVVGHFPELGYFSLRELESVRGPYGLPIERDLWWTPVRLSKVMCGEFR